MEHRAHPERGSGPRGVPRLLDLLGMTWVLKVAMRAGMDHILPTSVPPHSTGPQLVYRWL